MTLQIEEEKHYRRRDGLIVGPMQRTDSFTEGWNWTYDGCDSAYWSDGHYNFDGTKCPEDLVSEWTPDGRSANQIITEIETLMLELKKVTT